MPSKVSTESTKLVPTSIVQAALLNPHVMALLKRLLAFPQIIERAAGLSLPLLLSGLTGFPREAID